MSTAPYWPQLYPQIKKHWVNAALTGIDAAVDPGVTTTNVVCHPPASTTQTMNPCHLGRRDECNDDNCAHWATPPARKVFFPKWTPNEFVYYPADFGTIEHAYATSYLMGTESPFEAVYGGIPTPNTPTIELSGLPLNPSEQKNLKNPGVASIHKSKTPNGHTQVTITFKSGKVVTNTY